VARHLDHLAVHGDDAGSRVHLRHGEGGDLADTDFVACYRGWLAALRGDAGIAETMLAALRDMRASENPQDKSLISIAEAFTASARGQPTDSLRHARGAGSC